MVVATVVKSLTCLGVIRRGVARYINAFDDLVLPFPLNLRLTFHI